MQSSRLIHCVSPVIIVCLVLATLLLAPAPTAKACIGSDGTIPPFGGSGPNGIMAQKIQAAWADAQAKGMKSPPTPPISGVHPVVIILIENQANGATFTYRDNALWATRIAEIAAYYTEVSHGLFTMAPAHETFGTQNDGVIGPVTVPGLSSTSDISSGGSTALAVQAIQAANPYIDFASFDTNHDGTIEANELHIVIYQAGDETSYGANSTPRAWAHMSWNTPRLSGLSPATDSDGVNITSYCYLGSEFGGFRMASRGVVTHELGHDIGLPDLYDADGTGSGGEWAGLGEFCLMASGSWGGGSGDTPVNIDGFFKNWLGWASNTVVTAPGNRKLTLDAADGSNEIVTIRVPGSAESFVVENRQHSGFDAGMPGARGGLAIYHCDNIILTDYNVRVGNSVNMSPTNPGIALEEADGDNQLFNNANRGQDTDLFRTGNKVLWDAASNPNSRLKNGADSDVEISAVSDSGPTMTFDLGAASVFISISEPSASATVSGPVSYTLTYTGATTITLSPADVTLNATGSASGVVSVTGSGATERTVTISDITGAGYLSISIADGSASDGSGGYAASAGPSTAFRVGSLLPIASWPTAVMMLAAGIGLLRRIRRIRPIRPINARTS